MALEDAQGSSSSSAGTKSRFEGNEAIGSGGAVLCEDCRGMFVVDTDFQGNSVVGHGGAVASSSVNYRSASYILQNKFTENEAIYLQEATTNGSPVVIPTEIEYNSNQLNEEDESREEEKFAETMLQLALASGGAFSSNGGVHVLQGNVFKSNKAVNGGAVGWLATQVSLPLYRRGLGVQPDIHTDLVCALNTLKDGTPLGGEGGGVSQGSSLCRALLGEEVMVVEGVG